MFLEACKEPYRQIDRVNQELIEFETIVDALKKSCQLFDIQPPDEKNLKQCRREVKMCKVKVHSAINNCPENVQLICKCELFVN